MRTGSSGLVKRSYYQGCLTKAPHRAPHTEPRAKTGLPLVAQVAEVSAKLYFTSYCNARKPAVTNLNVAIFF